MRPGQQGFDWLLSFTSFTVDCYSLSFTIICCGWLSLIYWLQLLLPVSCAMLWVQNAAVGLSLSRHPPRLHQFFCLDVGYVGSWSWLVSSWRTWILIMNIIMCVLSAPSPSKQKSYQFVEYVEGSYWKNGSTIQCGIDQQFLAKPVI